MKLKALTKQESSVRSTAHASDQERFGTSRFVDNRPNQAPVQMTAPRTKVYGDNDMFRTVYNGKKEQFKDGEDPGGSGIVNVSGYDARVRITDQNDTPIYSDSVALTPQNKGYHKGHILAKASGGHGDAVNIFAQDGGQNTAGYWVSFERRMTNAINKAPKKSNVIFSADLYKEIGGNDLQYGVDLSNINSRD